MVKQFSNIRGKLIPWQQWMDRSLAWCPEADNNQECPSRFTTTIRRLIRPTNRSLGQHQSRQGICLLAAARRCQIAERLLPTFSRTRPLVTECNVATAARTTSHPFLRAGAFPVDVVRKRLFCDYTAVFRSCRVTLRFLSGETGDSILM